jgi:acetyltransferase
MVSGIQCAPIMEGARGEAPRDCPIVAQVISRYSQMIIDLDDEIAESDANPVLVYKKGEGAKVVDARIILKEE